jgi:ubiquinone/menaquinone biosynthesis C-methylase UbiE
MVQAVVERAGIKAGMTVADVGTGPGGLLPALSAAVGAEGKVLAEDIIAGQIEKIRRLKFDNVTAILGTEKDPRLPAQCCDVVLLRDAYHHFEYPAEMLAGIRKGLRTSGRLVIIDYYKRAGSMPAIDAVQHIRLDAPDVVKEVTAHGFRLISLAEQVPGRQYAAIFAPTADQ